MIKVSLGQQIEEIDQQIVEHANDSRRRGLRQSEIDYREGRLRAILSSLLWLQQHEAEIRAFIEQKKQGGAS